MAAATSPIPRFLLPQTARLWRHFRVPNIGSTNLIRVRYKSTTAGKSSKPPVLEKPTRFNPPSHGSRLPRRTTPRHYGGELSSEEVHAQKKREYPGVMAPDGTWSHWFWHSRSLHMFVTMVSSIPIVQIGGTPFSRVSTDTLSHLLCRALLRVLPSSLLCRTSGTPLRLPT